MTPSWRDDIDALQFEPVAGRLCMVHRLAFRSLTGKRDPSPQDCLDYFQKMTAAFAAAAQQKIARAGDQGTGNFHLTSRDIQGNI